MRLHIHDSIQNMSLKNKIRLCSYDEMITKEKILEAFYQFRKDKKQKIDVTEFNLNLISEVENLHNDLKNGTYTHSVYSYFKVYEPKERNIHKALVRDRVVHHLVYAHLYPFFDRKFITDSYSCRLNKGTHRGVEKLREYVLRGSKNRTKPCYILKCDIQKFFASIDHEILKNMLAKYIIDQDVLRLMDNIIDSFHTTDRQGVGLPLGNLTSQLLVNIYMNAFDQYMKHKLKQVYYIRYADDFVIISQNKIELENLIVKIREFLFKNLKLDLHPKKVFIRKLHRGVDFLGWIEFGTHRILRNSTKKRMFRNLKNNNHKKESIDSYRGLLKHGNTYKLQTKIKYIQI